MITEYTIELRMEKSIQRITQPICIRINENETQQIRAKLMYENSPYSVQCDSAELHLLRDDGTWSHLEASVSGSSVTCTIKANQLGKHAQNACAYFFFKKGTQTETTESFQVRIERAAIDTEASDAFFDTSMNRIATKWGAYEATAEAQESARQSTESKRVTAEQERAGAEQARVTAEQKRVSAEQERASAEQERKKAEQERVDVNELVMQKESERREAERSRVEAEQSRAQAEQARVQAESARQSNESTRTSAEQSRQSRFNEMLDAAQNVKFRILSASEVDSEGKPTITGSSGIIYLVKAQQAQETQANHYNEWIYLENRWELFGSTAPTAAAIEIADIDKLANGTTIAGNRVLNATGLSALWSKLNQHFRRINNSLLAAQGTATDAKQASASNTTSLQALSSKQSTFEEQASNQLKALRTWAESTLESKMQERYNAGFKKGKQEGGEEYEGAILNANVDDFVNIAKEKDTSDMFAFISKLTQGQKYSLLYNDPDRVMGVVLPGYAQAFFKTNWDTEKNYPRYYWSSILYCRMSNTRVRALAKNYIAVSNTAEEVVRKKDAFYARFGTSKLAEIAKNPTVLFSLSSDDFANACYAYVCDGTANLKVDGAFRRVCEAMGFKWYKVTKDNSGYYHVEGDRYSAHVDIHNGRAYQIQNWDENFFTDNQWDEYFSYRHITIKADESTAHKTEQYGIVTDTQCTLTLCPFVVK